MTSNSVLRAIVFHVQSLVGKSEMYFMFSGLLVNLTPDSGFQARNFMFSDYWVNLTSDSGLRARHFMFRG